MADRLCEKLQPYIQSGQPVNLRHAFKAFAADTAAEYCFADNGKLLDKPQFNKTSFEQHLQGGLTALKARYLPWWYIPLFQGAPSWIRDSVEPAAKHFGAWYEVSPG